MGYTTEFTGSLRFDRPMTKKQTKYIQKFCEIRHMKRNAELVQEQPDPLRQSIGLAVGLEGGYYVGTKDRQSSQDHEKSVINVNLPPDNQPGLWCNWTVNDDGNQLSWDGSEKFYNYIEWLKYLIAHFFQPWGYTLNGEINFQGEDSEDTGTIIIKDNILI